MNRNLFIVRHAQTHHSQQYNSDKERELKPEGIIQATQLGKYLYSTNYNINLIMASDAERAKTTALLIANSINYPADQIKFEEKIYSGVMIDLLSVIKKIPESIQNVLFIGHNPTLAELNNYITLDQHPDWSTCELNLINITTNWTALDMGCGKSVLSYTPSLL